MVEAAEVASNGVGAEQGNEKSNGAVESDPLAQDMGCSNVLGEQEGINGPVPDGGSYEGLNGIGEGDLNTQGSEQAPDNDSKDTSIGANQAQSISNYGDQSIEAQNINSYGDLPVDQAQDINNYGEQPIDQVQGMNSYGEQPIDQAQGINSYGEHPIDGPPNDSALLDMGPGSQPETEFLSLGGLTSTENVNAMPSTLSPSQNLSGSESTTSLADVYSCQLCPAVFNGQTPLDEHKQQQHGIQPSFKCHVCGHVTTSRVSLMSHCQSVHGDTGGASPVLQQQQQQQQPPGSLNSQQVMQPPPPLYRVPDGQTSMPMQPPAGGVQPQHRLQQYGNQGMMPPSNHQTPQGQMVGQNPMVQLFNQVRRQYPQTVNQRGMRYPVRPMQMSGSGQGYSQNSNSMLQQRPMMASGQRMPYNVTPQRRAAPLMNMQQPISVQDSSGRTAAVQKRNAMSNHQSPMKQRRMDVGIPAKQNDTDCQIIAVQQREEGVPVIQNVQGATSTASPSSRSGPESTIHLTDSITLSVRPQAERSDNSQTKKGDATAVASLLATRGITVTPAGPTRAAQTQKQTRPVPQPPPPPPPPPPPVATLKLNSAISIIPSAGGARQQQHHQQHQQPQQQQNSVFTVPSAPVRGSNNRLTSTIDRPPRPPTVDLTGELPVSSYNSHTRRFTCQVCDQHFPSPESLRQHMSAHHSAAKQLPHRCHLCNAQYPTALALQQHLQRYHKETPSTNADLAIPVVNMRHPGAVERLAQIGVQNFIPLSHLQNQGAGYFGLPLLSMNNVRTSALYSLQNLPVTNVLSIGPLRPLPR